MRLRAPSREQAVALAVAAFVGGIALVGTLMSIDRSVTADATAVVAAYPAAAPVVDRLVRLAAQLNVKPQWIANVIQFESGWNPAATNPSSRATGLIQFYPDSTDRALGTTVDALRGMSTAQQFYYVERYFLGGAQHPSFVGRLHSQLDVFMAVFEPAAIGRGAAYAFSEAVRRGNPGIATAADYYNSAMKHARMSA